MTALVVTLTVMVAVLAVLVAGLLRSHATILKRLHEWEQGASTGTDAAQRVPVIRTFPGVPEPLPDPVSGAPAPDISGRTLAGESVVVRTGGVAHDTVLVFLSSGCSTCQRFFSDLARPVRLPAGTRLVIMAKGAESESPAALAPVAPGWADLVMSDAAWADYRVPGSPYVVAVDGPSGRVKGEGTGMSWEQVAGLLAQATGDIRFLADSAVRTGRPVGDLDREARADRELMAAGILPGDPSLYPEGPAPQDAAR